MFAYVNGQVLDESAATVGIFDHGFTVGDGVFETIAIRNGRAIAARPHLERLVHSAVCLGLARPDVAALQQALEATMAANEPIARGAARVTYTSGTGAVGSGRASSFHPAAPADRADPAVGTTGGAGQHTLVIGLREIAPYEGLAEIITVPWPRNERGALAGLKTTSYAENAMALADAHRQGATEAIFANTQGNLCEGTGTNIFVVLNGELITPPLSAGCLAGISRGMVIDYGGVQVDQRDLPMEVLYLADEAFLTSSTRDVQPIHSVDGRGVTTCPGKVTEQVMAAYAAHLAATYSP